MDASKKILGAKHPDMLTSIVNLASTYRNQGRQKKAEELEIQVIDIRKKVLGVEHLDILIVIVNMVYIYWNQEYYDKAFNLIRLVWELYTKIIRKNHSNTIITKKTLKAQTIFQNNTSSEGR